MIITKVNASTPYNVYIGKGLIDSFDLSPYAGKEDAVRKAAIITDEIVSPLYLYRVIKLFKKNGFEVCSCSFEGGEEHKTLDTVGKLLSFLLMHQLTRTDVVVALGGGIVGDVVGFAASVYLRGLDFIQIPTTLLAAVDSSVGGKTGVNFEGLKNQVGCFHQPSAVICDVDTFSTLPPARFSEGISEVIKYGVISSPEIFTMLENRTPIEEIVAKCVSIKALFVEGDEYDKGERQMLNFGHTVGHAIEKLSHGTVSHGNAVAVGMVVMTASAACLGYCTDDFSLRLSALLKKYNLPVSTDYTAADIAEAVLHDKKRSSDKVTLVLPEKLGKCILVPYKVDELAGLLGKGLSSSAEKNSTVSSEDLLIDSMQTYCKNQYGGIKKMFI